MAFTDLLDSTAYGDAVSGTTIDISVANLGDVQEGDLIVGQWVANVAGLTATVSDDGYGHAYFVGTPSSGTTLSQGYFWCRAHGNNFGTRIRVTLSGAATRKAATLLAFACSNKNPQFIGVVRATSDSTSPVAIGTPATTGSLAVGAWPATDCLGVGLWGWRGSPGGNGFSGPAGYTAAANQGASGGSTTEVRANAAYNTNLGSATPTAISATFTSISLCHGLDLIFSDLAVPDPAILQHAMQPYGNGSTSFALPIGAPRPGSILVLNAAVNQNSGNANVNTPAGWTLVNSIDQSTDVDFKQFVKVADGTETSVSVTINVTTSRATLSLLEVDGALFTSTVDASSTQGGVSLVTTGDTGTQTPTGSGRAAIEVVVAKDAVTSMTEGGAGIGTVPAFNEGGASSTVKMTMGVFVDMSRSAAIREQPTWTTAARFVGAGILLVPTSSPHNLGSVTSSGASSTSVALNRTRPLAPASSGASSTTASLSRIVAGTPYGEAIQADGLNNAQIGPSSRQLAYAFRAKRSDNLVSVSVFIKIDDAGGYSGGTHGTLRLRIETDDGTGKPSGTLVAAGATVTAATPTDQIQKFTLGTAPALVQGTVYHAVFANVDASPTVNFPSINNLYNQPGASPLQPTIADADQHVCVNTGSGWSIDYSRYPIYDAEWAGGAHDGVPFYDCASSSGQKSINGTQNLARMTFTPTAGKVVTGAVVRVARGSGTTQPLVVKLKTSGGTVLDQFSIPAASAPVLQTTFGTVRSAWIPGNFSAPVTLTGSITYYLELSSPGETVPWIVYPIEQGSLGGYGDLLRAAGFAEGYLENTTNGGASWATHSGSTDWKAQMYFATVSSGGALSGTSTGGSSTTASLNRRRNLIGTSTGSSNTTGALNRRRNVTPTSTGLSTTTAALNRRRNLSTTSTGVSTTSAVVSRVRALAATSSGASATSATLAARDPLAFPQTPQQDDFNTTAGQALTARSGWGPFTFFAGENTLVTDASGPTVAEGANPGSYYSNYRSALTDDRCEAWLILGAHFADFYLYARVDQTSGNGYLVSYDGAGTVALRRIAGFTTLTTIATYSQTLAAGDGIGVRCDGSRISAWYAPGGVGWTRLGLVFDTTYPGGGAGQSYIAIEAQSWFQMDAFGGGTIGVSLAAISGASTGASTSTATLNRLRPLSAASAGTGSTTATFTRRRGLSATSTGSSTTSSAVNRLRPLAAVSAGASSTSITINRRRSLAPTTTGLSTTSIAVIRLRQLGITSTGLSVTTTALNRLRPLAASSTGLSATTCSVARIRRIAPASTGLSTTAAALTRRRPLSITSLGLSSTSATVTSQHAPATVQITASSTASSSTSVELARLRGLTAASIGASTTTITVVRRRALAATSSGASTTAAVVAHIRPLSASSVGASTTVVVVARNGGLAPTSFGASTTTIVIARIRRVAPTSNGTSTTSASVNRLRPIVAASTGLSASTISVRRRRLVAPTSTASSTTSVVVSGVRLVAASSTSTATTLVVVAAVRLISATSTGASSTSAALYRVRALVAASVGLSASNAVVGLATDANDYQTWIVAGRGARAAITGRAPRAGVTPGRRASGIISRRRR